MSMEKYFTVPSDHHVAMDEMHRRIAPPCTCPSIIWHIALWPDPEIRSNPEVEEQIRLKSLWTADINKHLAAIEDLVSNENSKEKLAFSIAKRGKGEPRKSLYLEVHGADFVWQIKAESHYEFITLTVMLSLAVGSDRSDDVSILEWPKDLKHLTPTMLRHAAETLVESARNTPKGELDSDAELLHNEFWLKFAKAVCHRVDGGTRFPGKLISDFRELVVSVPPYVYKGVDAKDDYKGRAVLVVENYKPLIKAVQINSDRREFVVCAMLDWRVIYATTLGARRDPTETINAKDSNPVRATFLVVDEVNANQVGRLVERVNALGVARIAALVKLDAIRDVGRAIQSLGLKLDSVMEGDSKEPAKLEEIWKIQSQLNMLKYSGDTQISDGVTYRISRSEYYANLIDTRLDDLRVKRIEGWQPYDEFLRRRLYPTLKFVQAVRKRIQALRKRIDSAILSIESSNTRLLLEELRKIQDGIHQQEIHRTNLVEAQIDNTNKQKTLTKWVQIVTILAIPLAAASILVSFEVFRRWVLSFMQ